MPGFDDTEAIAVFPTDPGLVVRAPTVTQATGFDVHLEAESGNGVIGPDSITPYSATIQIRNLTRFALVTVTTVAANAVGNIGVGQDWNTNDEEFIFSVAGGSADIAPGDFLEILGAITSGNPPGDPSNDFSFVRSEVFQVI